MFKSVLSQQQLGTIATFAGVIVMIANQAGYVLDSNNVAFIIASLWSIGSLLFSYKDRYDKGDVDILGFRK